MKAYCTQNEGQCETCSLRNYGRDCRNAPLGASLADKLATMGATLDGATLVLVADHGGTGSPRVEFSFDGVLRRNGVAMSTSEVRHQLDLDGPFALWLRSQPTQPGRAPCAGIRRDTAQRGDAVRPDGHHGTAAGRTFDAPAAPCEYSYTPIDCGFDLRRHSDMAIELPAGDRLRVRYCDGDAERVIEGTRAHVAATLTAAGYRVTGNVGRFTDEVPQ